MGGLIGSHKRVGSMDRDSKEVTGFQSPCAPVPRDGRKDRWPADQILPAPAGPAFGDQEAISCRCHCRPQTRWLRSSAESPVLLAFCNSIGADCCFLITAEDSLKPQVHCSLLWAQIDLCLDLLRAGGRPVREHRPEQPPPFG